MFTHTLTHSHTHLRRTLPRETMRLRNKEQRTLRELRTRDLPPASPGLALRQFRYPRLTHSPVSGGKTISFLEKNLVFNIEAFSAFHRTVWYSCNIFNLYS